MSITELNEKREQAEKDRRNADADMRTEMRELEAVIEAAEQDQS